MIQNRLKMDTGIRNHVSSLEAKFALVTVWSVVGFLYCFDNNTQWGCVDDNSVLSFHNISRTVITFALSTLGFLHQNDALGRKFILAECVYWTLKLLFWKEGYVVGIAGSLPTAIVVFDFIALLLRLFLLREIFRPVLSNVWLWLPALMIMGMKVAFLR